MSEKTNVMRILDKAGITYKTYSYDYKDNAIDGVSVAGKIGQSVEKVYKTLVTQASNREYFVFIIPVATELNLKAAAKAIGEKSVGMIAVADIQKITGYIRGGCSPIGMKKAYKTVLDTSCKDASTIIVSAGKIGTQVELSPEDLVALTHAIFAEVAL